MGKRNTQTQISCICEDIKEKEIMVGSFFFLMYLIFQKPLAKENNVFMIKTETDKNKRQGLLHSH